MVTSVISVDVMGEVGNGGGREEAGRLRAGGMLEPKDYDGGVGADREGKDGDGERERDLAGGERGGGLGRSTPKISPNGIPARLGEDA